MSAGDPGIVAFGLADPPLTAEEGEARLRRVEAYVEEQMRGKESAANGGPIPAAEFWRGFATAKCYVIAELEEEHARLKTRFNKAHKMAVWLDQDRWRCFETISKFEAELSVLRGQCTKPPSLMTIVGAAVMRLEQRVEKLEQARSSWAAGHSERVATVAPFISEAEDVPTPQTSEDE